MYSIEKIVVIILLSNCKPLLSNVCDPNIPSIHSYNINRDLYIDYGNDILVNYNLDSRQFRRCKISDVFTTNAFQSVDIAFNFNYGECKGSKKECELQSKARHLVIAIGILKASPELHSYKSYYLQPNHSLVPITDKNQLIRQYKPVGEVEVKMAKQHKNTVNVTVLSEVFVKERNQSLACIQINRFDGNVEYETFRRKVILEKPLEKWTTKSIDSNSYKGMFAIDNRVFAINNQSAVFEAKWDNSGEISFETFVKDEKNFFNCFNDSKIISGNPHQVILECYPTQASMGSMGSMGPSDSVTSSEISFTKLQIHVYYLLIVTFISSILY